MVQVRPTGPSGKAKMYEVKIKGRILATGTSGEMQALGFAYSAEHHCKVQVREVGGRVLVTYIDGDTIGARAYDGVWENWVLPRR